MPVYKKKAIAMKKIIKTIRPKYVIDICAYLSEVALENIEFQCLGKSRLTNNELDIWTSVIDSVMSELTSRGFKIIKQKHRKDDYFYSFNFYPVSDKGEIFDLAQIRFVISDPKVNKEVENTPPKQMFRFFTVNGIECPSNLLRLMNTVGTICDRLMVGDYSSMAKL